MLKLKSKNGEVYGVVKGRLNELAADTICLVRHVWNSIKEADEESADLFKYYIEESLNDGVMFCGDDEVASVVGKAVEKIKKRKSSTDIDSDELLDALEQLKSKLEELEGSD